MTKVAYTPWQEEALREVREETMEKISAQLRFPWMAKLKGVRKPKIEALAAKKPSKPSKPVTTWSQQKPVQYDIPGLPGSINPRDKVEVMKIRAMMDAMAKSRGINL
jgi:hypothetical protein